MLRGSLCREHRNAFFWVSIIEPSIIAANVDDEAGIITTCCLARSLQGYFLRWTFIPITSVLIVIQEMEEICDIRADLISEEYKEGVLASQGENRPCEI